eukprot:TRINITY_DN22337_c0_g1_i1.p1 TRINITY_DN22337_c0_g1~~TRINITY_DN22337_c0_g1_i1.p1  ORF type:complete len:625 (+),score=192.67 TRINITY_DN22337_c0_g1_i1:1227-3101(+)
MSSSKQLSGNKRKAPSELYQKKPFNNDQSVIGDNAQAGSAEAERDDSGEYQARKYVKRQRKFADQVNASNALIFGESLKNLSKEQREQKVAQCFAAMTSGVEQSQDQEGLPMLAQLAVKHDSSRVMQLCIKYCTDEIRDQIVAGLKGHFVFIASNMYGYRVIMKLLAYHGKEAAIRDTVLNDLKPKLRQLAGRKESSKVIDFIWRELSNEKQRRMIIRSFYGKEFKLFAELGSDDANNPMNMEEILKKYPEKQYHIMKNVEASLGKLLYKHLADTGVCHRLLLEFVTFGPFDKIRNFIPEVVEHVKQLLQTKDGVRAVCKILQYATPKDRKLMVRCFKGHVSEMALDGEGYLALLTTVSVIDDVSLVTKSIQYEFSENMEKIVQNTNARKVIFQMLFPNNPSFLNPAELDLCKMVSGVSSTSTEPIQCSKKDAQTRGVELSLSFLDDLTKCLFGDKFSAFCGNMQFSRVILELVRFVCYGQQKKGDVVSRAVTDTKKDLFFQTLLQKLTGDWSCWSHNVGHKTIKKIVEIVGQVEAHDHKEPESSCPECQFMTALAQSICDADSEVLQGILSSPGTWVCAKLLELPYLTNKQSLSARLASVLKGENLKEQEGAGLQTLRNVVGQ